MDKPNILFVMADQLAAGFLSTYGNRIAKTPHLDALSEEGVVFEEAYCNSPLCAPSRASMMTGQLPSRIGAYDNGTAFPASAPTFAHYLRAGGYRTCLSGKMHFVGPDQLHGFEERLTTDIYPSDFGWIPDWEHPHERQSWYQNMLSIVQAGVCTSSNQLDFDEEVAFHAERKVYQMARDDDTRPFCLVASFTHPHDPFIVPREYWDRYDHDAIDMPTVDPLDFDRMDPHSQRLHHMFGLDRYAQTDERVRNARHAYYGMVSYIDDKVGRLLEALSATGQRDDTIVVFASDHGEMLGERGLWYKMSFFENSAHVPLIVHAPQRFAAKRVSEPVSLVDLLPTFVDLAGGADALGEHAPERVDPPAGRSLLPSLEGRQTGRAEQAVYGEHLGQGAVAPILMIRRGRYKYIHSDPDPEQLFDLERDPDELDNLADRPEFEALRSDFAEEARSHWDSDTVRRQVIASQRRRRVVHSAHTKGARTTWDFQPFVDATNQYMRNHLELNEVERRARFPSEAPPPPEFGEGEV